jgi:alpha-tubulin suppressor-like RCC1 family protein
MVRTHVWKSRICGLTRLWGFGDVGLVDSAALCRMAVVWRISLLLSQPLVKNIASFSTCCDTLICTMVDGSLLLYSVCDSDVPVSIERYAPPSLVLKTFSGGGDMILVLLNDGRIMVRGSNRDNQLQASSNQRYIENWTQGFMQYDSRDIKSVEFGSQHIVILDKNGVAMGYGCDDDLQLKIFKRKPLANVQKIQCEFYI